MLRAPSRARCALCAQALTSLAESIEHEKENIGKCHDKLRRHALTSETLAHAERDVRRVLELVGDVEAEAARVEGLGKEHDSCRNHLKANDAALHDATFKEHQYKRQINSVQERTQRMHKQHAVRKEAAQEGMETAAHEWREVDAERAATEEQLHATELQMRAQTEKARAALPSRSAAPQHGCRARPACPGVARTRAHARAPRTPPLTRARARS